MTTPEVHVMQKKIRQAAAALVAAGAREVYLFGSYAQGTADEDSDIDMAVAGLPPERFFRAMSDAVDILQWPLDLVDLDENSDFARYLKEKQKLVRVA